jgi:hypothetical protein
MKKYKKILTATAALSMSACLAIFAACGNNNTTTTGSADTTPVTVSDETTKSAIDSVNTQSKSAKSLNLQINSNLTRTASSYESDSEGNTKNGLAVEKAGDYFHATDTDTIAVTVDLESANVDTTVHKNTQYQLKEGSYADNEDLVNYTGYEYDFVRNWYTFSYTTDDNTAVTDFTGKTLQYEDYAFDDYTDSSLDTYLSMVTAYLPKAMPYIMNMSLAAPLVIGDVYKAVTVDDTQGTVTLDLNKAIYGLYTDLVSFVNKINKNTTIGNVLSSKAVKTLISAATYSIDIKDAYDSLKNDSETSSYVALLPEAKESDTVYTYLSKVLYSQDLFNSLNASGMFSSFKVKSFGDIKLSSLYSMLTSEGTLESLGSMLGFGVDGEEGASDSDAGAESDIQASDTTLTFDEFIAKIKNNITSGITVSETSFKGTSTVIDQAVTEEGEDSDEFSKTTSSYSFSNVKLVYTLSSGNVTSIGISGTVVQNQTSIISFVEETSGDSATRTVSYTTYNNHESNTINVTLTISDEEVSLVDIDDNDVNNEGTTTQKVSDIINPKQQSD